MKYYRLDHQEASSSEAAVKKTAFLFHYIDFISQIHCSIRSITDILFKHSTRTSAGHNMFEMRELTIIRPLWSAGLSLSNIVIVLGVNGSHSCLFVVNHKAKVIFRQSCDH